MRVGIKEITANQMIATGASWGDNFWEGRSNCEPANRSNVLLALRLVAMTVTPVSTDPFCFAPN